MSAVAPIAEQKEQKVDFRRIVVATDFSAASHPALAYGVAIARRYDSEISVVHAIFPDPRKPIPLDPLPRARLASHDPKTTTPIELVRLEEANKADPIMATILSGHLKYLGQEELQLASNKWRADKFELKVPLHAPFLLWTSAEGLLLAFAPETKDQTLSGDGMALVRFQRWTEF